VKSKLFIAKSTITGWPNVEALEPDSQILADDLFVTTGITAEDSTGWKMVQVLTPKAGMCWVILSSLEENGQPVPIEEVES